MKSRTALALSICFIGLCNPAFGRLTSLALRPAEPFAGGAGFGNVGPYERLIGTVSGELDPADPRNAGIADINLAPRNARGLVEYKTDVFILRPKDPGKSSGTLLYDVLNRGTKFLPSWVLDAPVQVGSSVNDPKSLADAGDALSFKRGDTIVWSGWEADASRQNGGMAIDVPVATENGRRDGPAIIDTVRDELVAESRKGAQTPFSLSFKPATLDKHLATLTVRRHKADPAETIPETGWAFADAQHVMLLPEGTKPEPGAIYDFTYRAIGPKVQGIGFAATRDLVASMRDSGLAGKLLGGTIHHTVAIGISQSGRFLRSFVQLGFNQDEDGHRVFDGMLAHISGVGGVFLNARFAQPSRTMTQHEDHAYPEASFPFSAAALHDPITGATGAVMRGDQFDPLLIETNTGTEYWQKGASLLTTDPLGKADVTLPPNDRVYLIASGFHYGRAGLRDTRGPCANARNTLSPAPILRALLVDLEDWVTKGIEPPPSRHPRIANGTLVPPSAAGLPSVQGFTLPKGADAIDRIQDYVSAVVAKGPQYKVLVPKTDAVGDDIAGIRLPQVEVPRATRTGWNVYAEPFPAGDLCDREGSLLSLAATDAAKTPGDPRPSLAALYPTPELYLSKVKVAVDRLVADRLLRPEDGARFIEDARTGRSPDDLP